jgi:hypothetical protein
MFMALLKKQFLASEMGHFGLCHEKGMSAVASATRTVLDGCFTELRAMPAIPGLKVPFVRRIRFPALNK